MSADILDIGYKIIWNSCLMGLITWFFSRSGVTFMTMLYILSDGIEQVISIEFFPLV